MTQIIKPLLSLAVMLAFFSCKAPQRVDLSNKLLLRKVEDQKQPYLLISQLFINKEYIIYQGSIFNEVLWKDTALTWQLDGVKLEQTPLPLKQDNWPRYSIPLANKTLPQKIVIHFNIAGTQVSLPAILETEKKTAK